jgi:hypothetical protein
VFTDLKPAEVFSTLASVGSLVVTGYFWFVRMRGERPRLKTHFAGLVKVDSARSFDSTWDPVVVLRVAVLNLSTLPNVVLSARGWVRLANGSWAGADVRISGGADVFNISPQVAEFRELTFELPSVTKPAVSAEVLEGMPWREALEPALGGSIALRVELVALNSKTFTDEFTVPAVAA